MIYPEKDIADQTPPLEAAIETVLGVLKQGNDPKGSKYHHGPYIQPKVMI